MSCAWNFSHGVNTSLAKRLPGSITESGLNDPVDKVT
jgi:hypothetical protein